MGSILQDLQNLIPQGAFGGQSVLPALPSPRQGTRSNPDGSESTHLMRREFVPNKGWVVFPSLFQDPQGNWIDLNNIYQDNWEPILRFAEQRGEAITFGNNEQAAKEFADLGTWKQSLEYKP